MKITNTPLSITKYGSMGVVLLRSTTTDDDDDKAISSRVVVSIEKMSADPVLGLEDLPALILLLQEITRGVIVIRDLEAAPAATTP